MTTLIIQVLALPAAALAGGAIGYAFGLVQSNARARYEQRQLDKGLKSVWSIAPGSMRRVAFLLAVLALIQVLCPFIFTPGSHAQWWASAGVAVGYGWTLYKQLRRRLS